MKRERGGNGNVVEPLYGDILDYRHVFYRKKGIKIIYHSEKKPIRGRTLLYELRGKKTVLFI